MKLHKLQQHWQVQPNNSILQIRPSPNQVQAAYKLIRNPHQQFFRFVQVIQCLERPAQTLQLVQTRDKLCQVIQRILLLEWCIIEVVSEQYQSYKGFISWILLASSDCSFLIDAGILHDHLIQMKRLLESEKVVKFMLSSFYQLNALKRDCSIFTLNIFDLEVLNWYGYSAQKMIPIQNSHRPISQTLRNAIQRQFQTIWNLIEYLPEYLQRNSDYLKEAFMNFNSADYILSIYHHTEASITSKKNQQDKENKKGKQNADQEQEQQILHSIFLWRQHTAKIIDVSIQALLPTHYIFEIVTQKAKSVLQISEIVKQHKLGMDQYPKILEAIKLAEETSVIGFQLPKKTKVYSTNSNGNGNANSSSIYNQSNLRALLTELNWNDKDWLNRKNDESIKMYKQIISIDQFDDSLAAPFIEQVSEKVLKKYEISRYIKFAQFMRNGNQTKLKNFYQGHMQEMQEQALENQKWNFNQYSDQDFKQNNEGQLLFGEKLQSKIRQDSKKVNLQNQKSKSNTIVLPQNIEEIYLMAAKVKKSYDKTQKSKKKTEKKFESKNDQFVPNKDELMNLLNL